ncbi:MAG: hypothetical protein IJC07_04155 [Clostridia bacterium]|nr:hypothetical protein [Clostridia bacterium]
METRSKAETFIGFAMRTGKYKIGANAVATLKRAYLVIVCSSASDNTKKDAQKLANRFNCPIYVSVTKTLEQITKKENAKVMAIADKALSKAILENLGNDFIAII